MAAQSVGIFAWTLPHVAILDLFGLNDRVIAHRPPVAGKERLMAHDRQPPPGYIECFRPNVWFVPGRGIRFVNREAALTDADIVACEERFEPGHGEGR
jgi:arabinofuranosyltransferase